MGGAWLVWGEAEKRGGVRGGWPFDLSVVGEGEVRFVPVGWGFWWCAFFREFLPFIEIILALYVCFFRYPWEVYASVLPQNPSNEPKIGLLFWEGEWSFWYILHTKVFLCFWVEVTTFRTHPVFFCTPRPLVTSFLGGVVLFQRLAKSQIFHPEDEGVSLYALLATLVFESFGVYISNKSSDRRIVSHFWWFSLSYHFCVFFICDAPKYPYWYSVM